MITDTPPAPAARRLLTTSFRPVAIAQGAYFLLTGLWPLFGIDSFQAVTGPKADLWLVYTVGVLVAVVGATLLTAAVRNNLSLELMVLAVGSAVALAGIDLVFVVRGVISWVYLLDAAAELGLVAWWVMTYRGPHRRHAAGLGYPHVQKLLARGQSISPNGTH